MKIKNFCFSLLFLAGLISLGGLSSLFFIKKPVHLIGKLEAQGFQVDEENNQINCQFFLKWNDSKWTANQVLDKMEIVKIFNDRFQAEYQSQNFEVYNLQTLQLIKKIPSCEQPVFSSLLKVGEERVLFYLISIIFQN